MAEGEKATRTPNTIYNLSSVLFHALEGGASYDQYIEGATRDGDYELAGFFSRVRSADRVRANMARILLAERTPTGAARVGRVSTGASSKRPPRRRMEEHTPALRQEGTGQNPQQEDNSGLLERFIDAVVGKEEPRSEESPRERGG
ncbi:MAG: hypothetical protein JOZ19_04100 [Rubrobacter sp.]|nr:hypothetical protein [Rubrobacter sp.]